MAALKEKGLTLLGTFTGSIATGANPTLFTTPSGTKKARIAFIVFRSPSASAAAATNLSVTGFPNTISLVNLTATTGYVVAGAAAVPATPQQPALGTEINASTAVVLTTTTGAAVTVTVDVFGYLG